MPGSRGRDPEASANYFFPESYKDISGHPMSVFPVLEWSRVTTRVANYVELDRPREGKHPRSNPAPWRGICFVCLRANGGRIPMIFDFHEKDLRWPWLQSISAAYACAHVLDASR